MNGRPAVMAALLVGVACVHRTTVTTTYEVTPPPGPNEILALQRVAGWRLLACAAGS